MKRALAFSFVLAAACSDSSTGTEGGAIGATCGALDETVVEGSFGETRLDTKGATKTWAWINAGKGSFDGTFEGGAIHLEWQGSIANGEETDLTAGTISLGDKTSGATFQSGRLVQDSPEEPEPESIVKTTLTFDKGTVKVCMRKKG